MREGIGRVREGIGRVREGIGRVQGGLQRSIGKRLGSKGGVRELYRVGFEGLERVPSLRGFERNMG